MFANVVYTVAIILYEARKKGNDVAKKFQYHVCGHGIWNGRNVSLLFKKI